MDTSFRFMILTSKLYLQNMSYINDLIGVLRGVRLVAEASAITQKEVATVVWNNSSLKPLLTSCPPVTMSFNPGPTTAKEWVDRALAVAHGLRQFAVMHIPNIKHSAVRPQAEQQMREEIDELNLEFNRTFETLKRVQIVDPPEPESPTVDIVAPIEDLQQQLEMAKIKRAEDIVQAVYSPEPISFEDEPMSSSSDEPKPKPVAKKKVRIAVSTYYDLFLFQECYIYSF